MEALDEHMRAGRLDPHEYAERSATASTARVRSELDLLFTDLPAPHPSYPRADGDTDPPDPTARRATAPPAGEPQPAAAVGGEDDLPELVRPAGAVVGRHAGLFSLLTPVVIVALVVVSGGRLAWLFVLVPVLLAGIGWLGHRHDGGR